jgi:hypothetical protein
MKNLIRISAFVVLFSALSSFTKNADNQYTGTYGVSEGDHSGIRLTLNEDKTFTYTDFSNPSKKIDVSGNWEVKRNVVILTNYTSAYSFHTNWKIEQNGEVAKSRKGLCFYTLGKI